MPDVAAYVAEAERRVWDVPGVGGDVGRLPVRSVGIVGAGTMGAGIAMNFATAGVPVVIVEQKREALDRGLASIRTNYENSARKGRFPAEEVEARVERIRGAMELSAVSECDLVIEAVFEDMELKKRLFRELDRICRPGAILATNTSALDVDAIAAETSRAASVIGLHFFSPANVMKLLEVVRGEATSWSVIATCMDLARTIGKIAVLVGVCPGFVGNRMLRPYQVQAFSLLMEGAMPWDVDRVLTGFGLKMGPFAMMDLAGLDVGWSRETSKGESLRDVLCEKGRLGQKSRAGFYDYETDRAARPSPITERLIRRFAEARGGRLREIGDAEILERCMFALINEGVRILSEGKAARPSDIDVVWLNGYGWPRATGGPMFYADRIGLPALVVKLEAYVASAGDVFEPSPLLKTLAREGRRLADLNEEPAAVDLGGNLG